MKIFQEIFDSLLLDSLFLVSVPKAHRHSLVLAAVIAVVFLRVWLGGLRRLGVCRLGSLFFIS